MFSARTGWGTWALLFVTFLMLGTISASAQLSTGLIEGVVKDPSGASVPEATITIQNTETGQSRTLTSGDDGAYRVPALPVGHYMVKIEKTGFKPQTQQLTLSVLDVLAVNATLEVGTSTQEVVVTGEITSLVNTTTSSLGGLVDEAKMSDLPLNGRNYIDLSLMQPGIAQNKFNGTPGVWFSSNGAPMRSNNFMLDGTVMNTLLGGAALSSAGTTLGVDGIREYKVVTSAFSAEYGQTMGSQMVMASKGGSNRFSGDVFEYLRNSAFDARNFFDYGFTRGGPRLPPFQRNNFGGSIGGPIKKDKTFFYAVYEGLRQNLGFTAIDNVPGPNCRGGAGTVVWNGQGIQPALSVGPCTQLGNNPSGPGTNSVTIKPVMVALLDFYPLPNLTNNQFTFATTNKANDDFGQIRIDQNFSTADSFFSRYTIDQSTVNNANLSVSALSTGVAFPQERTAANSRNQFLTLSENHIFSAALLNTARLSFSRTNSITGNIYTTPLNGPQYSFVGGGVPIGTVAATGLSGYGGGSGPPSISYIQNIYALSDDVFYTKGKHGLKFGVLLNRYNDGVQQAFRSTGSVTFSGLATFLAGVPITYNALTPGSNFNRYYIFNTYGMYAQDDWRATSRLTVNMGLRYEFWTTPTETNGRGYAIRNDLADSTGTQGPIMINPSLKNFSPRVGFAYDITGKGKSVVRSAFGEFYDVGNIGAVMVQNSYGTPPISNTNSVSNAAGAVLTLPFTFPAGTFTGSPTTTQYYVQQPHTLQYNLTVEQQLPGTIGLSVSYVGLRGIHIWTAKEGNPLLPTSVIDGQKFFNPSPSNCANVVPSCRINPNLGSIFLVATSGDSWYSGLQVVVNKKVTRGLEFQSSYSWGKLLDTTQANQGNGDCSGSGGNTVGYDPLFPKYDKGFGCTDVKNNWRFNLLYHFPSLKSNNFAAKLIKGWWMGNIVSVQSGYPFTPTLSVQRSRSGANSGLGGTDRVSLGTAAVAPGQAGPGGANTGTNVTSATFVPFDSQTVITGKPSQWYNPLMFTIGQVGYFGNASRGMLRMPGLGTWDFSLVKDTPLPILGERGSVQFRAEFFNLLNRANFGAPNGTVFSGTLTDISAYSETPSSTAGQITTTLTTSRQIQFALKMVF